MSEYQESYYPENEQERKRRRKLRDSLFAHELASRDEHDISDLLDKETKRRQRIRFAELAGTTEDVVTRGQYMVAAGLAKVFHYEYYKHWSLYEMKKGIFSRKERHEDEETRESVTMEANEDES